MRIKWIDSAKGIAMLCIILGHIGGGIYGKLDFGFVYAVHLSVFFLLSGYTLKKQEIAKEYVNKKFKRLMEPYFFTCVAIMIMDVFNISFFHRDEKISTITYCIGKNLVRSFFASGSVTNFAGIGIETRIGAIWFLPAMFFATLIVQWALNHFVEEWKRCVAILCVFLIGYISADFIWLPFSIQSGMTASAFILTGYYIKKYSILERLKRVHYLACLGIFAVGVYKGYHLLYIVANVYPDLLFTFCVSIAGSFLLLKLAKYMERSRILSFIGKQSVYFLCVHLFALETMGGYFDYLINALGVVEESSRTWMSLLLNVLFASSGVLILLFFLKLRDKIFVTAINTKLSGKRDYSIDIMRGILIIAMLVGYSPIDINLRKIIFSCHMVAFVFLSGYFDRTKKSLGNGIIRLYKSFLIPYGCFCLGHLILHLNGMTGNTLLQYLKSYILSISCSKILFTDVKSIGSVYFVTMLFGIKIIYLFIDNFINSEKVKIVIVIGCSTIGAALGKYGYWLPWSFDCALYCLIFYEIGVIFRRYNILDYISDHYELYFIFSIVWAYMIYISSMEIAIRQYTPYGLVLVGAMCGILLLYMCSQYMAQNIVIVGRILSKIGENTLYILIVHSLAGGFIFSCFAKYFNPENIAHMAISIFSQIGMGVLIGIFIKRKSIIG